MQLSRNLLQYHWQNRYFTIFDCEGLRGKMTHIKRVIEFAHNIARYLHSPVDMKFLAICAEHHDDGRVNQHELLGKFYDGKVSHNTLSIERLNAFLLKCENAVIDESIEIMRDVMLYHGRMQLANLSDASRPYVEIISTADDFENALSCVDYLLKEVENDEKGYIESNPQRDQTEVSDFVFEHFMAGEKFDKMKYCTTYGEYIIFAATLATNCIKRYPDIAKIALLQKDENGKTILVRYKEVFEATLNPEMAEKAFAVLSSKVL